MAEIASIPGHERYHAGQVPSRGVSHEHDVVRIDIGDQSASEELPCHLIAVFRGLRELVLRGATIIHRYHPSFELEGRAHA